jgi:AraC family transcriptional regulator
MGLETSGVRKYPSTSGLLASSAGLGWSALSVELRSHGVSEAQAVIPQHVEICLVIAGNNDGLVRRTAAGMLQDAVPKTGAIWLSPASAVASASPSEGDVPSVRRRLPIAFGCWRSNGPH